MEGTVISYISMLLSHSILIAVPRIGGLEVINDLLLDLHFVVALMLVVSVSSSLSLLLAKGVRGGRGGRTILLGGGCDDLQVDLGADGPVILVKALLAAQRVIGIEYVMGFAVYLIASTNYRIKRAHFPLLSTPSLLPLKIHRSGIICLHRERYLLKFRL